MNKKHILIAVVVIALIAAGCYLFFNGSVDTVSTTSANQKTILLSKSAYMEVPDTDNVSDKVKKNGVHYYKNEQDDINITSCSNLSSDSSSKELKKLKNSVTTGAKKSTENGVVIYEKNGTYSIFVKNTQYNDTLLIQSSNKNLLLQCSKSVQFHDPAQKIDIKNDDGSNATNVIDVIEKTESAVSSSSSDEGTSTSDAGTSTTESSSPSTSTSSEPSASASDWGYDWSSSDSGGSSSDSGGDSIAGGSASDDSRFDFT